MRSAFGIVVLMALMVCLALVPGCNQKVTADQLSLLQTSAAGAKERAASAALIAPTLKSKDPTDQPAVDRLVKSHINGLSSEALMLASLQNAAQTSSTMSQAARDQISDEAATAKGRAANFEIALKLLDLTADQKTWSAAHLAALQLEASNLAKLVNLLTPPAPAAPAK
jgi:hypothetical protein